MNTDCLKKGMVYFIDELEDVNLPVWDGIDPSVRVGKSYVLNKEMEISKQLNAIRATIAKRIEYGVVVDQLFFMQVISRSETGEYNIGIVSCYVRERPASLKDLRVMAGGWETKV